jgi:hypothetical protein
MPTGERAACRAQGTGPLRVAAALYR